MSTTTRSATAARLRLGPAFAAVLLVGVALPFLGMGTRWLWLDELLSANYSASGPWATLVTVLRFDVHPPLYYLPLSVWMLFGQSDAWLMALSVFWHAAAVGLLTLGAARLHGMRIGLGAGLLLALSPAALAYADQVRMYAFLEFLIVWAWYAQARWLDGTAGRWGALWMILSQAAVAASHTGGLLMLSGIVLLGAASVLAAGRREVMLRWFLIECAVAVLAVPSVVIGLSRGVTHLTAPGLEEVLAVWAFLSGAPGWLGPLGLLLGGVVLGVLLVGALRDRRLLLPIVTLVFVPLLIAGLLSHVLKPVWIERLFVTVVPFVCLSLARIALGGALRRAGLGAFVALALVWGGVAVADQLTREKGDGFRLAALAMRDTARPGDLVLTDAHYPYWCFLWYFEGPDWGDARHAFVLNEQWERMMRRIPSWITPALGLEGAANRTREVGSVTVALWDRRDTLPEARGDIFVLRTPQGDAVEIPGRRLAASTRHMQITLERWVPAP